MNFHLTSHPQDLALKSHLKDLSSESASIQLVVQGIIHYTTATHFIHYSLHYCHSDFVKSQWGWSGGAMVLGKLLVPGRPTI